VNKGKGAFSLDKNMEKLGFKNVPNFLLSLNCYTTNRYVLRFFVKFSKKRLITILNREIPLIVAGLVLFLAVFFRKFGKKIAKRNK